MKSTNTVIIDKDSDRLLKKSGDSLQLLIQTRG